MSRVGCWVLLVALGCTGEIGGVDGTDPEDPDREALPFAPIDAAMQRLTVAQYQNSVTDVLGEGLTMPEILEPDTTLNGFVSIGASRTTISPRGVESYEEAAYELAAQALSPERRDSIVTCSGLEAGCTETFVRDVGRRLWRRPLTEAEVVRWVDVADNAASTLGDFYAGLEFALAGFLQSPNFLFRVELGEPDGDTRRYTDYEMASRLSYVLWNSTPDEELLQAAERGELTTEEGLRAQVDRLLASDRSREAVRNFFTELLVLDDLDSVEKSAETFPQFTESFRASAREETLALVEHLIFEDADYRELFTTDISFVDAQLASHYGIAEGETPGFSQVTLPPERRGLLGHASILSIYAHDEKTSAALRGRFVRQVLLCGTIPPPPPDVSTVFPPSSAPTLKERVEQHLMNDGCSSCHALMDPIGLGLENFDAIGGWRDTENGATIDPSGVVDEVFFTDGADLGRVVADHPDLGQCITRNFFRYAVGETESGPHFGEIGDITDRLEESGYRLRVMMAEMMMSRSFREAGEPTP